MSRPAFPSASGSFASALALAAICCAAPASWAQRSEAELIIEPITPSGKSLPVIAIPTFQTSGSDGGIAPDLFGKIICQDLEWFSDFKRAPNQKFVDQTDERDRRSGDIDFAEWQRLGCNLLLNGNYRVQNGILVLECRLYDVDYRQTVFAYGYKTLRAERVRQQAHIVSDKIVEKVYNEAGIANTRIVFVSNRGNSSNKEIYVMDADGQNAQRLSRDNSLVTAPAWGQNGTEMESGPKPQNAP